MDIYDKLYECIGHLNLLKDSNLPAQTINFTLANLPYPTQLKNALFTNPEWSLKVLSRYKKHTEKFIENEEGLEKLLQFVENKNIFEYDKKNMSEDKIKQIEQLKIIDGEVKKYLWEQNFFQKLFDEAGATNIEISKQDVIDYKKAYTDDLKKNITTFEFRKNQLETINHLKNVGLETGIHCESTGCGKSIEILLYISHCYKLNPKCKIILFTERVNIKNKSYNKELNNLPKFLEKLYLPKEYNKEIKNLNSLCVIEKIDF